MKKIDKVGGVILKGKKLLVVRKRTKDNREEYIIPGGKREGNESDFETLKRELSEEIQVELIETSPFGVCDSLSCPNSALIFVRQLLISLPQLRLHFRGFLPRIYFTQ